MRGLVRPIHQFFSIAQTIARQPQWRYHVSTSAHNPPKCERFAEKIVRKYNNLERDRTQNRIHFC
jgi:hypothetical protein